MTRVEPLRRFRLGMALCAGLVTMLNPSAHAQTEPEAPQSLRFVAAYPIYQRDAGLTEPSGLQIDAETGHFWTVSDDTRRLFRIDSTGRFVARGLNSMTSRTRKALRWT